MELIHLIVRSSHRVQLVDVPVEHRGQHGDEHALNAAGHAQCLHARLGQGERRGAKEGLIDVLRLHGTGRGPFRDDALDQVGELRRERQEDQCIHHVEDRVGVCDLALKAAPDGLDPGHEQPDKRDPQEHAGDVEHDVRACHTLSLGRFADR